MSDPLGVSPPSPVGVTDDGISISVGEGWRVVDSSQRTVQWGKGGEGEGRGLRSTNRGTDVVVSLGRDLGSGNRRLESDGWTVGPGHCSKTC